MAIKYQVRRQPGEQKIKKVISGKVSGTGSPKRPLPEDVPEAWTSFGRVNTRTATAGHPFRPRGKPQQTQQSDRDEYPAPTKIRHQESSPNRPNDVAPL